MREFIKMFFWGMVWFFVPLVLFAIALVLIVAYGFQALVFIVVIISGFCWLLARNPAQAHDFAHMFFTCLAISVVLMGLSVACLGKVHKWSRALRARTTPSPRYEVYPSDEPFR